MTKDINQWNNSVSCVDEELKDFVEDFSDSTSRDVFASIEDDEDEGDWVEEEDLLEDMAPCDYSGVCGGSSCSCYAKCHGWVK